MPPENREIFLISDGGLNADLDKMEGDIKKTSFEDALKIIGKSFSGCRTVPISRRNHQSLISNPYRADHRDFFRGL